MVSLCIKTNKNHIIEYLLYNLSQVELEDIVFVKKDFSKYSNVIIHYLGNNTSEFYSEISSVITNCIIDNYESKIIHNILLLDYFYFDDSELNAIEQNCHNMLNLECSNDTTKSDVIDRKHYLWSNTLKYILYNKSIILDGFVAFRVSNYIDCICSIIDFAVSEFVINREYAEFIDMFKLYINSRVPKSDLIHLVYMNEESVLLDENKHIISLTKNNLDSFYLSDISFSSNDYALNSLLSLLPRKLIIHLISPEDDFINTLKSIFGNTVEICTKCNICTAYKSSDTKQGL